MDNAVRRGDGTPWGTVFSLLAAVFYGVSPIDIIPDLILVLGWMDDAVAVPTFLLFAGIFYARHRKAARMQPAAVRTEVRPVEPVIPESYDSARV